MKVQYKGPSHFRVLDASDMKKFGVDGFKKTSFARRTDVEVPDEVGKVLVETLGEFVEVKDDDKTKASADDATVTPTAGKKSGGDAPAASKA